MNYSKRRRTLLLAAATAPLVMAMNARGSEDMLRSTDGSLADLELDEGGRLGVYALDTAAGHHVQHRATERFPFCSTSKTMICAAVLAQSVNHPALLQQRIALVQGDIVSAGYTPVTQMHVGAGMTVAELCAAAVQYSDNAAANLLIGLVGGPSAVTAFARSIGDRQFRLDRLEPALNTALPDDPRDTTTPAAMAESLRVLVLSDVLRAPQRAQLIKWLRNSTTGKARIRAGVPMGWQVGDKTGTGAYGTTNDIAVLWPPSDAPIVLTVYYTGTRADAKANEQVIASATRIALAALQRT
jgi:beta-lactamase class A